MLAPAGALVRDALAQPTAGTSGRPTGQHATADEAALDTALHAAMENIYRSRLPEAARISDDLRRRFPNDPRPYLLEARILRETFPDQSTEEADRVPLAAPIHGSLQRCIELCDQLIATNPQHGAAYGYRGWAHLFRAQMHTLLDEYWSAGREAKRGKSDLDRALEIDAHNTDAKGILGTYLYFADVLPRVVKVARTLVRVPGGDRKRGIALLQESAAGGGYNRLDARALVGAIQFGFEGNYDAGIDAFESILVDFPDNPRMTEPIAALDLVRPRGTSDIERIARIAVQWANDPADWYRQLAQRLTFYQSLAEILQGRVDDARQNLDGVRRRRPTQPDWFPGVVSLCLTEAHLLVGDAAAAQRIASESSGKIAERLRFVHAKGEIASPEEAAIFRRAQDAARHLYDGDAAEASRLLEAIGNVEDPAVHFYRGEIARVRGDGPGAMADFQKLTDRQLPGRWRLFKLLAFSRLAELQAVREGPRRAAETLARAMDFDQDRDLLRHLVRARRRHYDLLSEARPAPVVTSEDAASRTSTSGSGTR